MNEPLKFINQHKINDGLLREFVIKELWPAAIQACDSAIEKRMGEIRLLQELSADIGDEIKDKQG